MIYEKAPAKINLSLDILHKRDDGFHEVEMVMTTVDLADRLAFEKLDANKIIIESDSHYVPNDERNLAYQAAKQVKEIYGVKKGVKIKLDKNIPVAAGLAGGSSDAAAALRGVNRLFELNLAPAQLQTIGEKLGSDIPFCVTGGTALAYGRGEKLKKLPPLPASWIILAKPSIGVSTKDVYGKVDLKQMEHPQTGALITAPEQQSLAGVCENLGNVLEPITVGMHPEVGRIKERMIKAGADGVQMSGSGPTVFAIVSQKNRAERVYNSMKGFCKEVYMVRSLR